MCFSATASFVAAGTIGGVGAATLAKVDDAADLPLATIPLLFGIQQATEGVLWLALQNPELAAWGGPATYVYSLFSHVLWPMLVPFAALALERDRRRRIALGALLGLGFSVGLYLLFFMVTDPVTSEIVNHSIRYDYHHHYPGATLALYLIAVCVPGVVSSQGILRFFGAALVVAFVLAVTVYTSTFFSVWCFFAAGLSVMLYLHFRETTGAGGAGVLRGACEEPGAGSEA